jgi:hypothetical protein
MRFLNAVQVGILYSAPTIVLLVAAVWCWAHEKKALSVVCALAGAVVGSLLARFTRPAIGAHHEPLEITAINIVSMGVMLMLLVAYLGTETNWSNWRVDLGLAGLAGVSLAVAQGLASQRVPVGATLLPSLALVAGGAMALVGIRRLKGANLVIALASAALLAALMTVAAHAIMCRYWTQG